MWSFIFRILIFTNYYCLALAADPGYWLQTASKGWRKLMFLVCSQGEGRGYLPLHPAKVPTPPIKVKMGEVYPKVPTPSSTKVPTPLPIQVRMGEGVPQGTYSMSRSGRREGVPQGTYTPLPRYLPPPRDRTAYGVLDTLPSV